MGCLNLAGIQCRYTSPLKRLLDANVVAPWVECGIEGNGRKISVGNNSSPPGNTAIIKSFQFGLSTGMGCNIEIFDEEGGEFVRFFKKLTIGGSDSIKKYLLRVRWGWQMKNCSGPSFGYNAGDSCCPTNKEESLQSCVHTLVIRNISVNYSAGGFKFILEGTDTVSDLMEGRARDNVGSAANPVHLVPAVEKFLGKYGMHVRFIRLDNKCNPAPIKWQVDTPGGSEDLGPKCDGQAWQANGKNPLETAVTWVFAALPQTKNKGIQVFFADIGGLPTLVFMEATSLPDCDKIFNSAKWNVGTYLVNGGNCVYGMDTVLTEDGWRQIHNVVKHKYAGKIACVDDDGLLAWNKIVNWYRSERKDRKLIKVHLHHSQQRHGSISGVVLTDDHRVLTNNGWRAVRDLDIVSDKIHSGHMVPGGRLHEAIIGMMLGDAHIGRDKSVFDCIHSYKQFEYCKHKSEILGVKLRKRLNGNPRVTCKANPYWRVMRKSFYDNVKGITADILSDFTLVSLAYLMMDDGHLKLKKKLYEIATCCFSIEEVELLIAKITSLGIPCYRRPNSIYPRIYFGREASELLSAAIAKYVPNCMNYKLYPEHRGLPKELVKYEETPFFDTFDLIRCVDLERKVKTVYCLDVENAHNFITHGGVVHNCSPVISFQPNMKYSAAMAYNAGGQTGGPGGGPVLEGKGPLQCLKIAEYERMGMEQIMPIATQSVYWYFLNHQTKAQEKLRIHQHANINWSPISAELRIQGDPIYNDPFLMRGRYVSVIVMNPFHIGGNNGNYKWQYLAGTECNEVLSNKNWMIDGVMHDIRDGSYTTTLKLRLPAPGMTIPAGSPLGGDVSCK